MTDRWPVAASAPWPYRGLTKRYGEIVALDGLDLDVPAGSVFGFLGPNGAGKTTTLRLLTSLAQPTSGSSDGRAAWRSARATEPERDHRLPRPGSALPRLDARARSCLRPRRRPLRNAAAPGSGAGHREVLELVGLADAARPRIGGYSRRDAPAAGPRPGGPQPPAGAAARRAGERPRSRRAARHAGHDRSPGPQLDRPLLDPHPQRRRARLRPGRDPRPRAPGDRGAGGRAAGALRGPTSTCVEPEPATRGALAQRGCSSRPRWTGSRRIESAARRVRVSVASAAAEPAAASPH